jgi:hypothetical protein
VEFKPSSPSGCSNNLVERCDFRPDSWGVCHIDLNDCVHEAV